MSTESLADHMATINGYEDALAEAEELKTRIFDALAGADFLPIALGYLSNIVARASQSPDLEEDLRLHGFANVLYKVAVAITVCNTEFLYYDRLVVFAKEATGLQDIDLFEGTLRDFLAALRNHLDKEPTK